MPTAAGGEGLEPGARNKGQVSLGGKHPVTGALGAAS